MAVRKIKDSWWVDLRCRGIRYRERSPSNTKGGAQEYETYLRYELASHGSLSHLRPEAVAAARPPTLQVFAARWMRDYVEVNNKPSEQRAKRIALRLHILPRLGPKQLDEIRGATIESFKRDLLDRGLAAKTVNNVLAVLRKLLNCAADWECLAHAPRILALRAPPPPFRYLDDVEIDALLGATDHPVWHDMILTAVRTGLRFSELVGLEWADVDFRTNSILVQHAIVRGIAGSPKNNRTRRVFMTSDLLFALTGRRRASGHVFEIGGRHIREATAWEALQAICVRAGVRPMGWHALRHTFASDLAQRGASLQGIKELLGHSSLQMTLRYAHVSESLLRQTIALLDVKQKNGQPVGNHAQPITHLST